MQLSDRYGRSVMKEQRYIDLLPKERERYERAWGGILPVDAEVGVDEGSGYVHIGTALNARQSVDADFIENRN